MPYGSISGQLMKTPYTEQSGGRKHIRRISYRSKNQLNWLEHSRWKVYIYLIIDAQLNIKGGEFHSVDY